jgi:ABC-type bacteriocin/lantibiotic exporter with double-glycine peptidase domain
MKTALYAAVCERIFHMPDKILRRYKTTELADCVLETDRLLKTVGRGWNASFVALLSMVYIVQMYSLSPMLTGQALVFTLLLLVILVLVAGKTAKREKQTILLYEEAKSRRDECFSGLEKVKSFGMQERILHHCLTAYAKEQKSRMASDRARKRIELIAKGAGSIASAFLYWCMIARHETFQTGWFIAFMASFGIFLSAMTEFGTSMAEFMVLKSLFNRVRPILETAGEYTGGSKAADIPEEDMETTEGLNGELEVSELDFAYEEEDPLFEKFSLHVNAGEFIGITGISGSGKTTLMKLLLGMEKPDRGKIYYGTSDLEQMDLWELRKKCAIVLQNDRLIEGSIRDNLCLSGRKVSEEEMLSMTDRLRLTGEIEELPDGFDTKIREDGKVLNATQRQKILIARALLKQPSMIFFDEATMDLDDESQDLVLEYLRRFKGTRFVISNRISAIAHCDRILVMNRGKVAESGNYRSLMKKKGAFYKTAIRQMV